MVVSNHPLASARAEMLAAGGNAIDAAIATLFTLTVVEPMMVGIIGGGMAHIRLSDGSHRFIDGQAPFQSASSPTPTGSKPGSAHDVFDTVDDENLDRSESGRGSRPVQGLVRDVAAVRHHEFWRMSSARDQACCARLCGDALLADRRCRAARC